MASKYDNLADIWKLKQRGKRDSERHKELVERAIRKHGKDIITEHYIIKADGDKKIKVPVKYLDRYRVKYGKLNRDQEVGQGVDGKPGDKYKIKEGPKGQSGSQAGDQEGERVFEAEITIDELVDIMMDELNLPWMDPKNTTEIEVEKEEFDSVDKQGIMPNLHLKKTLIQNMRRNAARGRAYIGDFDKDDLRYRTWETQKEYHSNAAVYLMMDRSGSMDKPRIEIAKTFYFWMVQFLKKRYKNIELVFIAHDSQAFLVDEKEFFTVSSMGGTKCSSAYKLAYEHMKATHPADQYNCYVWEFSDGDNWGDDNSICVEYVNKLLPMVRAIGYGEILLKDRSGWLNTLLLSDFFNKKVSAPNFVSMKFKSKDDIFDNLKSFFSLDSKTVKAK